MDTELQIVFRNMDHSDAIENTIRDKADKLEHYFPHIVAARVIVEIPHRSPHNPKALHATIEVSIPGHKLVVSREPGDKEKHRQNPMTVINDSFDAMYKQLRSEAARMKGEVKTHELPPQGRILKKFPNQDYGFIRMADGREIYFHRNSVVRPDFDDLEIDQPVRVVYARDESPMGPQATTVEAISDMQFVDARAI